MLAPLAALNFAAIIHRRNRYLGAYNLARPNRLEPAASGPFDALSVHTTVDDVIIDCDVIGDVRRIAIGVRKGAKIR